MIFISIFSLSYIGRITYICIVYRVQNISRSGGSKIRKDDVTVLSRAGSKEEERWFDEGGN